MTRTDWVIKVLTDSYHAEIDCKNEEWLRDNIELLDIGVCVESCIVNTFDIANSWPKKKKKKKKKTILIQNGTPILFKSDFNPLKEALLITEYFDPSYLVALYSPRQFKEK